MLSETETETGHFALYVERMLAVTNELHDSLQSLTSANGSLRFYIKKLVTKLTQFSTDYGKLSEKCSICLEGRKNHCLNPCGHVMCEGCCQIAIENNKCFVCRSKPEGSIKTFGWKWRFWGWKPTKYRPNSNQIPACFLSSIRGFSTITSYIPKSLNFLNSFFIYIKLCIKESLKSKDSTLV